MAVRVGTAYIGVRGDWSAFTRQFASQARVLTGQSDKLGAQIGGGIGRAATAGLKVAGAGAAGALIFATKKAADFESQLSSLGAVSNATARQMEQLRRQALKAGADTKFSALEAAQAQTELAKGGLTTAQILRGGLRSALALAAAGELELGDAAAYSVNAMKLFGLRGKDAMKVADGFATAANRTTADVSDFGIALTQGGSAAKAVGLSFTETTAALEALAEGGIKGSDAGTSLKAALTQLASPTLKAQGLMEELGLRVFDAHGEMKPLADVSGILRDKLGDLTREQRLQTITTLVGTDGMRALLSLYEAGPTKIARFEQELSKQGTAADVARKKQDNLKGSMEQLSGSLETLGITIGSELTPFIRDAADDLTHFTNQVSRIFNRDDLDLNQKLARIFDVAKVDARPWARRIGDAIEAADLGEHFGRAVSDAAPVIANALGRAGLFASREFARAFLEADPIGRLVLGGVLLSKLGGLGAFRALGFSGGVAAGTGFAAGAGQGVAANAGTFRGRATALFRSIGIGGAIAAGVAFGPELVKQIQQSMQTTTPTFGLPKNQSGFLKDFIKNFDLSDWDFHTEKIDAAEQRVRDFGDTAEETFQKLQKAGDTRGLAELAEQARALGRQFPAAQATLERFAAQIESSVSGTAVPEFQKMRKAGGKSLEDISQIAADASFEIKQKLGYNTAAGKEALSRNMKLAAAAIRESMRKGTISTRVGTREIRELMVASLQQFGFTPEQARNELRDNGRGRFDGGREEGATGHPGLQTRARGGLINVGKPTGDSVPALLERGEFVLNRKAVQKVGLPALHRLNFQDAPRFQRGGMVSGDTDYGSALARALEALARATGRNIFVQSGGRSLGEQAALARSKGIWSPSNPQGAAAPSPNAPHVRGIAADITPGRDVFAAAAGRFGLGFPVPGEPWHIQLMRAVAGLPDAGGAAPRLRRVMFARGLGAVTSLGQRGLDQVRAGAQRRLDAIVAASGLGGDGAGFLSSGGSGGEAWRARMREIADVRGWNFSDWAYIVANESDAGVFANARPSLKNPTSTAFGLGQLLDSNYRIYGGGPGSTPVEQIEAMAAYIADRYGNPTVAANYRRNVGIYRKGGLVATTGNRVLGGAEQIVRRLGGPRATLRRTLATVRTSRKANVRREAIRGLLDKLKTIGMPTGLQGKLDGLMGDADVFGEYADRAGRLTDPDAINDALQGELTRRQAAGLGFPDAEQASFVEPLLARVNGRTQREWLVEQLGALFKWRNAIIDAQEIVAQRKARVAELIKQARARLEKVVAEIRGRLEERARIARTLKDVKGQIDKTKKNPKRRRALRSRARDLQAALNVIDRDVKPFQRERETLTDKVLPALRDQRDGLDTAGGDLTTNLDDVQGTGSTKQRLVTLPEKGALGGKILDVQLGLDDLAAQFRVTDTSPAQTDAPGEDPRFAELADILREQLREEKQRTLVSESQFRTIRDARLPSFGGGGIVPGPTGAPRVIEAHGNEGVFTPEQMAAMGGHRGGQLRVVIEDHRVRVYENDVELAVDRVMRRQTRPIGRTPLGGSLRG